ncbi:MAG: T9SS type A sorting domain-containing protein, partial [Cytophagales bacterium]|nr:T9SS type A sorting domain-containing protein [Cytophagales bacterium]
LDVNSVDFADAYEWSITGPMDNGWAFRTSQNAQLTRVTAGHQPVTISVIAKASGCADSEVLSFTANINPAKPQLPVITQSDCITPNNTATLTLEITDDPSVTSYVWNVDQLAGISAIGGNGRNVIQVEVAAGADINQAIKVSAENGTGCSVESDGLLLMYGDGPNTCYSNFEYGATQIFINFGDGENNSYEWFEIDSQNNKTRALDNAGNPLIGKTYFWNQFIFPDKPRPDSVNVIITKISSGCVAEFTFPADQNLVASCSSSGSLARMGDPFNMDSQFLEKDEYMVSPNPSSTFLDVSTNSNENAFNGLYLINSNGEVLLKEEGLNSRRHRFDTFDLAAGMYYLLIKNERRNHIKKIIIKK